MKIVLFIGDPTPVGTELRDYLKANDYYPITTTNLDEIDQAGKQVGKAILVFSDPKFAYRFLIENNINEFPNLRILYLRAQPIVKPEAEKQLREVNLNVYHPGTRNLLVPKLNDYLLNDQNQDSTMIDDLQFLVDDNRGKK
jgi:hypothetical protein